MKRLAQALIVAASLTLAAVAFGDDAQGFMQTQHTSMSTLLKQPASGARDTQIATLLDGMIDYEELTRRSFGQPCPVEVPSCTNHWAQLSDAQKTEVTGLVKKLVQKNYRKNLIKTLEFEISYKGQKDQNGEFRVKTEAKSKVKPRDPAVQIDYVLRPKGSTFSVVNIITEGSSLSKNYYDQFHKMMITDGQGYPYVVQKLNAKINAI